MRATPGDTIRIYGYPGHFTVEENPRLTYTEQAMDHVVRSRRRPDIAFPILDASVVEINGRPCCLRSCPIAPPADDYPHVPTFDYDDGPRQAASQAIAAWTRKQ